MTGSEDQGGVHNVYATQTCRPAFAHACWLAAILLARVCKACFVSGLNNIHVRLQVTVFDYKCRDSPGGLILKDTTSPHSKGVAVVGFPKSNFSFTNVHFHNM